MGLPGDIHLFASHKGGTGKTLLTFQIACQYANTHSNESVIVFDLTELGDLTKRMFGHNLDAVDQQCGAIFDLIDAVDEHASQPKSSGIMSFFSSSKEPSPSIDFSKSVRPGADGYNPSIPENVYLVSSGAATQDFEEFDYNKYAASIRESLAKDDVHQWKVFIDTDGDRRPAPYTKLGYALADFIVVPVEPDLADFERLVQMVKTVGGLSEKLAFHCKISQVIWNKVQLKETKGDETGSFKTTKVGEELINVLNAKLFEEASRSELFLHRGVPLNDFVRATVCRVRDFPSTVALPSNAQGVPFCRMQPGKLTVRSVTFQINSDQISGAVENIEDVIGRLQSMVA